MNTWQTLSDESEIYSLFESKGPNLGVLGTLLSLNPFGKIGKMVKLMKEANKIKLDALDLEYSYKKDIEQKIGEFLAQLEATDKEALKRQYASFIEDSWKRMEKENEVIKNAIEVAKSNDGELQMDPSKLFDLDKKRNSYSRIEFPSEYLERLDIEGLQEAYTTKVKNLVNRSATLEKEAKSLLNEYSDKDKLKKKATQIFDILEIWSEKSTNEKEAGLADGKIKDALNQRVRLTSELLRTRMAKIEKDVANTVEESTKVIPVKDLTRDIKVTETEELGGVIKVSLMDKNKTGQPYNPLIKWALQGYFFMSEDITLQGDKNSKKGATAELPAFEIESIKRPSNFQEIKDIADRFERDIKPGTILILGENMKYIGNVAADNRTQYAKDVTSQIYVAEKDSTGEVVLTGDKLSKYEARILSIETTESVKRKSKEPEDNFHYEDFLKRYGVEEKLSDQNYSHFASKIIQLLKKQSDSNGTSFKNYFDDLEESLAINKVKHSKEDPLKYIVNHISTFLNHITDSIEAKNSSRKEFSDITVFLVIQLLKKLNIAGVKYNHDFVSEITRKLDKFTKPS